MPGEEKAIAGAAAPGDFAIPYDGERHLCKGGYAFILIGGETNFLEYAPDRGGLVEVHLHKPPGTLWA